MPHLIAMIFLREREWDGNVRKRSVSDEVMGYAFSSGFTREWIVSADDWMSIGFE